MLFWANKRLKMKTMSKTHLYNASRSTKLVLGTLSFDFVLAVLNLKFKILEVIA